MSGRSYILNASIRRANRKKDFDSFSTSSFSSAFIFFPEHGVGGAFSGALGVGGVDGGWLGGVDGGWLGELLEYEMAMEGVKDQCGT